ncbi:hypothetical protein SAY87_026731 [Trapa incisa]|uniref:mRNA-decapping enzyme-like protein n=1 Tax=Trapa incisa TaxID=236973 RepID=A0AAN7GY85_9MYRT|nr:hypothetical protein SAY87_026731 [Trapa incisa]
MSQPGKLMPNLDQSSTKQLNLTVLQRLDPSIEEILMTAAHVTLYEFNIESSQWSRKDVEGSLFVVKRNGQPRFQFIVMNRRNTENLVENLLGDFEYEIQLPYLLYRNSSQEVNGIWFYNSHECEEVANLFSRIINAFSKVSPRVKGTLNKSELEELEAASNMANIMDEPLEPSATISAADAPENSSFMNFFNASLNVGNNPPNMANSRTSQQAAAAIPTFSNAAAVASAPPLYSEVSSYNTPSLTFVAHNNSSDMISNKNLVTNLVKPSSFMMAPSSTPSPMKPPILSAPPAAASLLPPTLISQRPYGTPLLQPFPPPTPSLSLTPTPTLPDDTPFINRDRVRDALLKLVQDDQFIDMFYKVLLKVHHS